VNWQAASGVAPEVQAISGPEIENFAAPAVGDAQGDWLCAWCLNRVANERDRFAFNGKDEFQDTDAVVTAAHWRLNRGMGTDGTIHTKGGPAIYEECRRIGGCPIGDAVITTGGNLKARHVIHAVGPVWHGGDEDEPKLLASAYCGGGGAKWPAQHLVPVDFNGSFWLSDSAGRSCGAQVNHRFLEAREARFG